MNLENNYIQIELLSDTTFGCGEGVAGVVDIEIEHDEYGLPVIGGKGLRGLLRDSWVSMQSGFPELTEAGTHIFGNEGDFQENSILRIDKAVVDESVYKWIIAAQHREKSPVTPAMVLEALTVIRKQTSEDRRSGAPLKTSLRSSRVIIRGLTLYSPLIWLTQATDEDIRCLSLAVQATRRAGLSRNRGRGHIQMSLNGHWKTKTELSKGDKK